MTGKPPGEGGTERSSGEGWRLSTNTSVRVTGPAHQCAEAASLHVLALLSGASSDAAIHDRGR
ncbi:hypothetical protein E2C01_032963 [Portunus trituberculatus]|uniref:Uncharacterized protein n=1 Tax=Portunus trituberculatus TaxID=210409 RepID=A0A5B7F1R2_PORTR|nr:hypothetical protein [Portunus trituberculatus]